MKTKLCECGCGGETRISHCNDKRQGWKRGESIRFINGHHNRGRLGDKSNRWKGGRIIRNGGYVYIYCPEHPMTKDGYISETRLICEKALGKLFPSESPVHHVDEKPDHNTNSNLVLCNDNAYHKLLHMRARALEISGHANWRICNYCHEYDDPTNLLIFKKAVFHQRCSNKYRKDKRIEQYHRATTPAHTEGWKGVEG